MHVSLLGGQSIELTSVEVAGSSVLQRAPAGASVPAPFSLDAMLAWRLINTTSEMSFDSAIIAAEVRCLRYITGMAVPSGTFALQ